MRQLFAAAVVLTVFLSLSVHAQAKQPAQTEEEKEAARLMAEQKAVQLNAAMPDDQKKWVAAVAAVQKGIKERDQRDKDPNLTDLQKDTAKKEMEEKTAADAKVAFTRGNVKGWVGTINEVRPVYTVGEGKNRKIDYVVVVLNVHDDVMITSPDDLDKKTLDIRRLVLNDPTWSKPLKGYLGYLGFVEKSFIPGSAPFYKELSTLSPGDMVTFSGVFPSYHDDDVKTADPKIIQWAGWKENSRGTLTRGKTTLGLLNGSRTSVVDGKRYKGGSETANFTGFKFTAVKKIEPSAPAETKN